MPTISKLIAAILFGATAFFAGEAFKLGMPEGMQYGQYSTLCVVIGLLSGWRVMGRQAGQGYGMALGFGIRTSAIIVAWAILLFCTILMVRKAFKKRYDSPMEAIVDIFALALEYGSLLFTADVLGALIVGGIIGGLGAEWAKRRWD
ncbi:TrgA family protein (plasmid) [Pseudorhodobacter turbinis]|uniref:TrgA family protein n=1 Tax=Pseudorhodobacter turbinis TaxID=2500533 RepID=A0A4P8EL09_9RHOB|nr:TrgA family protein [Pseudorhodobacter turbinis]QCO57669.1 TrgA family protein [Pseudorhodobacter turbinis]